jgi:hypothetical protein
MGSPILSRTTIAFCALPILLGLPRTARSAGADVLLAEVQGEVSARPPQGKDWARAERGARLADGTRLKTGPGAEAKLKFPDGTETRVRPGSEIVVRPSADAKAKPNGLVLMLGRVWSSVVKSEGGETSFEVRSANAVAGVRGTQFEVGVALDGSARVMVKEGEVGVEGESDQDKAGVTAGQEVEANHSGRLDKVRRAPDKPDWDGWFTEKAKAMEKQGLEVARELDGRLNKRKDKLQRLVREQKTLRSAIESLESRKKRGEDVGSELEQKFAQLERVTARLEDMKSRLQGAFGLFEKWGAAAKQGSLAESEAISRLASDVAKVAVEFADMIEEGTDLSPEGMEDLMNDMKHKKRERPEKNAGEELFK